MRKRSYALHVFPPAARLKYDYRTRRKAVEIIGRGNAQDGKPMHTRETWAATYPIAKRYYRHYMRAYLEALRLMK